MYLPLMQPLDGVDPGEGNGRTGTTSCQQAGSSVNDLIRVGSDYTHAIELEPDSNIRCNYKNSRANGIETIYRIYTVYTIFPLISL